MAVDSIRVLVVVNAALAVALAFLWLDQGRRGWVPPEPIKPDFGQIEPVPPAMQTADVSRFRETLDRPLFSHTRRPGQTSAVGGGQTAAVDPFKDVQLLGLFSGGERGGAVINMGGRVQRVQFGQKIGDWTVAGVQGRSVTLVRGESERRELSMSLRTDSVAVSREAGVAAEGVRSAPPVAAAANLPAANPPAESQGGSVLDALTRRYARALARQAQQAQQAKQASSAAEKP